MDNLHEIHGFRSTRVFGYIVIAAFIIAALVASCIALGSATALAFPEAGFETVNGDFMSVGLTIIGLVAIADIPARPGLIIFSDLDL